VIVYPTIIITQQSNNARDAIPYALNAMEMGMRSVFLVHLWNITKTIYRYATVHLCRSIMNKENYANNVTHYAKTAMAQHPMSA